MAGTPGRILDPRCEKIYPPAESQQPPHWVRQRLAQRVSQLVEQQNGSPLQTQAWQAQFPHPGQRIGLPPQPFWVLQTLHSFAHMASHCVLQQNGSVAQTQASQAQPPHPLVATAAQPL